MRRCLLFLATLLMFTNLVWLSGCATVFGSKEAIQASASLPNYSDERLYEMHSKACLVIRTSERMMDDRSFSSIAVWGPEVRDAENFKYRLEAEMRRRGLQVPAR